MAVSRLNHPRAGYPLWVEIRYHVLRLLVIRGHFLGWVVSLAGIQKMRLIPSDAQMFLRRSWGAMWCTARSCGRLFESQAAFLFVFFSSSSLFFLGGNGGTFYPKAFKSHWAEASAKISGNPLVACVSVLPFPFFSPESMAKGSSAGFT